jgi:hypothetical protein
MPFYDAIEGIRYIKIPSITEQYPHSMSRPKLPISTSSPTAYRSRKPAAFAYFVHIYIDRDSQRPVEIPAVLRRAVEQLEIA